MLDSQTEPGGERREEERGLMRRKGSVRERGKRRTSSGQFNPTEPL